MLLAIIMDHYAAITAKLNELNELGDAPSLILQTQRFIARRRKYRKGRWIPLHHLLVELQDEKENLHPEDIVTVETLMKTFPKMKEEQAQFLYAELKKERGKDATAPEDEMITLLRSTQAFMNTVANNLHSISMSVLRCDTKLVQLDAASIGASQRTSIMPAITNQPKQEPYDDGSTVKTISNQLDAQQRVMRELCEQLAKQQLSSESMAKALGEVAQLVPAREPIPVQRQPQVIQKTKPTTLPPCCIPQDGSFNKVKTPRN
jgi:hypothetical protein